MGQLKAFAGNRIKDSQTKNRWKTLIFLFLIITAPYNFADFEDQDTDDYSLTISGGISLGVYQAGLNWIIIESLRNDSLNQKPNQNRKRLTTLAGASAGAINTLASAFRYCEKEGQNDLGKINNNLFEKIWLDADITRLLPSVSTDKYKSYDSIKLRLDSKRKEVVVKDSILARGIFSAPIEALRDSYLDGNRFRANCQVDIAIMVTKSVPIKVAVQSKYESYDINVQSFVVPLTLKTELTDNNQVKLSFINNLEYAKNNKNERIFDYLHLPEIDNSIHFDSIARLALSSSAFPAAFGRVEMDYCRPGFSSATTNQNNIQCPGNYIHERGAFIDGGIFNNIPINKAVELMENSLCPVDTANESRDICIAKSKHKQNHVFVFPERLRGLQKKVKTDRQELDLPMDLRSQASAFFPAIGTLMSAEIYRSIVKNFKCDRTNGGSDCRNLLMTNRYQRLTGNFFAHFGAFLSPSFREHDYAVGIYDGLNFVANQACPTGSDADCFTDAFLSASQNILKINDATDDSCGQSSQTQINREANTSGVYPLIARLIENERDVTRNENWQKIASYFNKCEESPRLNFVFNKLLDIEKELDFKEYVNALNECENINNLNKCDEFFESDIFLNYVIKNPDHWQNLIIKRAATRLSDLEDTSNGKDEKILKAAVVFLPDAPLQNTGKGLLHEPKIATRPAWYRYVPDQIGLDARQSGGSISWVGAPKFLFHVDNFDWEVDLGVHIQPDNLNAKSSDWAHAGLGLRRNRYEALFSSWGLSVNANQNLSKRTAFGSDVLFGAELSVGFFSEKLRFAVGKRDFTGKFQGEDWTVRLSLNDIDSFLYTLTD